MRTLRFFERLNENLGKARDASRDAPVCVTAQTEAQTVRAEKRTLTMRKEKSFPPGRLSPSKELADSVKKCCILYFQLRKATLLSALLSFQQHGRRIQRAIAWKKFILALVPFLCYILVLKFNNEIRHYTKLEQYRPPNYVTLPYVEKTLFFCLPHRIISGLANPFFDVLAGIPYMVHYPLPFLFAFYLGMSPARHAALYPYMWHVGWVNLVAILFQVMVFPAAPPWYSDHTVLDFDGNVVFEVTGEAEFYRLDYLLRFPLYQTIYSQSPFKWGAFPSLHVALPAIIMVNHPWGGLKFGILHVVWISLAAMYATEHYLIDVLAGIALALVVKCAMLRIWSPFPELDEKDQKRVQRTKDNPYIPQLLV